jgi:hypothetical protein
LRAGVFTTETDPEGSGVGLPDDPKLEGKMVKMPKNPKIEIFFNIRLIYSNRVGFKRN